MNTRARTSSETLRRAALDTFLMVASELGLDAVARDQSAHDYGVDIRLGPGEVVHLNLSGFAQAANGMPALDSGRREHNTVEVVVADQIPGRVREALNRAGIGWLDRRGHLRLVVAPRLYIDTDVPARPRGAPAAMDPIAGRSGLAAAVALLMNPDDPATVAEIARSSGLNESSISRALARLDDVQLAERIGRGRYRPLVPDLFWALADGWSPERRLLDIDLDQLHRSHGTLLPEDPAEPGWALAGERAAIAYGAPLVATGDFPALLYVPADRDIGVAVAVAPPSQRRRGPSVMVSVDPTGLATVNRIVPTVNGFPLVHPLIAALDLSGDSRGREALEQWNPPPEFTRVW